MDAETKALLKENLKHFVPQIAWTALVIGVGIYCWSVFSDFLDAVI